MLDCYGGRTTDKCHHHYARPKLKAGVRMYYNELHFTASSTLPYLAVFSRILPFHVLLVFAWGS
jgi:hypothetical protein